MRYGRKKSLIRPRKASQKPRLIHPTDIMKVDYNDGYEFERKNGGFYDSNDNYSSMAQFEALSDNRTRTWIEVFEVPKVVETDTASPLLLKFVAIGHTPNNEYRAELPITIQLR